MPAKRKLNISDAEHLKELIWNGRHTDREIAVRFNISVKQVRNIKEGIAYPEAHWPDGSQVALPESRRRVIDLGVDSREARIREFADDFARRLYAARDERLAKEAAEKHHRELEEFTKRNEERKRQLWPNGEPSFEERQAALDAKREELFNGPIYLSKLKIPSWERVMATQGTRPSVLAAELAGDKEMQNALRVVFGDEDSAPCVDDTIVARAKHVLGRIVDDEQSVEEPKEHTSAHETEGFDPLGIFG